MATFVIGDIHGKYKQLKRLLKEIRFNSQHDTLWCTGDLVNRGKKSLEVMQFCESLGDRFISVLGNHDVFLLALHHGFTNRKKIPKTLLRILEHSDADRLMVWLRSCPFLHYHVDERILLVHAGVSPLSTLQESLAANEALRYFFQSPDQKQSLKDFLCHSLMGNKPRFLSKAKTRHDEYRYFINCFTRMRYCNLKGAPSYAYTGVPTPTSANKMIPWYDYPNHPVVGHHKVVFGHWATLANYPITTPQVIHLDTGCAWGGRLTALCLTGCPQRNFEVDQKISVSC